MKGEAARKEGVHQASVTCGRPGLCAEGVLLAAGQGVDEGARPGAGERVGDFFFP